MTVPEAEQSTVFENDLVSMGAASTITFHMGAGTDTATHLYLGLPRSVSYGIEVFPTVACSITEINGRTLKSAMSVGTGGWRAEQAKITQFTVQSDSATVVEVMGKGGN